MTYKLADGESATHAQCHPTGPLGMSMEAESYRNQIDRAIRDMDGEAILNGSHAHASIIIERMFAHAHECVVILTRKFDPRIYGTAETVEQAQLFLGQSDRKCQVLIEELDQTGLRTHPFIAQLSAQFGVGNLEIRQLPEHLAEIVNVNFSVMDKAGFRFEEDKKEAVAVAAFGKGTEKFVSSLRGLFERLWSYSNPVDIDEEAAVAQ